MRRVYTMVKHFSLLSVVKRNRYFCKSFPAYVVELKVLFRKMYVSKIDRELIEVPMNDIEFESIQCESF